MDDRAPGKEKQANTWKEPVRLWALKKKDIRENARKTIRVMKRLELMVSGLE